MQPITKQIDIKVETYFQEENSDTEYDYFVHAYQITIVNNSDEVVQLQKRHWSIWDSNSKKREVDGEGVVGERPILVPGSDYTYVSGCHFSTAFGTMKGHYIFSRMSDDSEFKVMIPEFVMQFPPSLS